MFFLLLFVEMMIFLVHGNPVSQNPDIDIDANPMLYKQLSNQSPDSNSIMLSSTSDGSNKVECTSMNLPFIDEDLNGSPNTGIVRRETGACKSGISDSPGALTRTSGKPGSLTSTEDPINPCTKKERSKHLTCEGPEVRAQLSDEIEVVINCVPGKPISRLNRDQMLIRNCV